jgi:CheY-like chemotaxis protein
VADPGQIEQILMNLAANARDAMPRGGTLTIGTQNVDVGTSRGKVPAGIPPGSYVMLTVTDTGSGMSEATRQQIFEPFFTTKTVGAGTGLGLATVYGIVKQNGGWIDVQSELGKGAAFHIWLPRISGVAAARSAVAPRTVTGGSERLLLVEDQEDVRNFAVEVLESRGYSVLPAADAESALALVERHPDPIHLLVTDVVLPGINGWELAQRLKASRPAMQVLFASGYAQNVIAASGVLEPGMSYIAKPYTPAELSAKVRQILAGNAPGNAPGNADLQIGS